MCCRCIRYPQPFGGVCAGPVVSGMEVYLHYCLDADKGLVEELLAAMYRVGCSSVRLMASLVRI